MQSISFHAAQSIQVQLPANFIPRLALILGSGLGDLADQIESCLVLPYGDIEGFFQSTVEGHHGSLKFGWLHGVPVVAMMGRVHLYEGAPAQAIAHHIHTLKCLGVEKIILTNASGSLNPAVQVGELSLIEDHINMQIP